MSHCCRLAKVYRAKYVFIVFYSIVWFEISYRYTANENSNSFATRVTYLCWNIFPTLCRKTIIQFRYENKTYVLKMYVKL